MHARPYHDKGALTQLQLQRCLLPVMDHDVLLVTDGHAAYRDFAAEAGISHQAANLRAGIRVQGAAHVQNVNAYHSRLREWLRIFHGVASRYLPNYLGGAGYWTPGVSALRKHY